MDQWLGCPSFRVAASFRRGDAVFPNAPRSARLKQSGLNIEVSNADFDDLAGQVRDATRFLQHRRLLLLRLLRAAPGATVVLDFGLSRREAPIQCDYFPPALLKLAGNLGIGIELAQHPAPTLPAT